MSEKFEQIEATSRQEIFLEPEFVEYIPEEFLNNPFEYFESQGMNIKSGEIQYDENNSITEDPNATKDFPEWVDSKGKTLSVVGKKVNLEKSQIKKTDNPFHEYDVMQIAKEFNLPVAKVIAKVVGGNEYLIMMERIVGIRWNEQGLQQLLDAGFSPEEVNNLIIEAEEKMANLAKDFKSVGLERKWHLKDMIFQIDLTNKILLRIVPTDWERTKINVETLEQARTADTKYLLYSGNE